MRYPDNNEVPFKEVFWRTLHFVAITMLTVFSALHVVTLQNGELNSKLLIVIIPALILIVRLIHQLETYGPAERMKKIEDKTDWDT